MEHILKSRYKIGEKISENPFSVTYRGFFIGTDKPVVIKIYKRGTLNSSLIRSMKIRVRDFSLISHNGIAKLLDGDYGWQGFYYVREFVEGQSLREVMQSGVKIEIEKVCVIADQVLAALEAAHTKGIVHAALKPSNIFIDHQGLVKLTDFVIESEVKESMPQKVLEIIENAKYASPEELEGRSASPVSDLFSLGLIMYEMIARKPLVAEAGVVGNIQKLKAFPLLPKEAFSIMPHYLSEVLQKALQKDPLLRFASASEFRESLERKNLVQRYSGREEFVEIFQNVVTEYGGEEIDRESEALQDVGRVRIRWGKEKHRNWILAVVVGASVVLGILYAFFFGR